MLAQRCRLLPKHNAALARHHGDAVSLARLNLQSHCNLRKASVSEKPNAGGSRNASIGAYGRDAGSDNSAQLAFVNSPKPHSNSTTRVGGIARIVHSGAAHAVCTDSAGKNGDAIVSAVEASQGQKNSSPQIMRISRIAPLFCQRVPHPSTTSRIPGSKRI